MCSSQSVFFTGGWKFRQFTLSKPSNLDKQALMICNTSVYAPFTDRSVNATVCACLQSIKEFLQGFMGQGAVKKGHGASVR